MDSTARFPQYFRDYQEDEIQALIVLAELTDPVETPNNNFYTFFPDNIAEAQTYFRGFALDLSNAFEILTEKGLVRKENVNLLLTQVGQSIAGEIRRARPPIWYFYKDFYTSIENSRAFSEYCRRVFGRDLSQHGFSDLDQMHKLLELVKLDPTSRVLDIGCGNGKIAEYISDLTQASVTGIDYVPEAITQAVKRTKGKRNRLHFSVGNLENLNLEGGLFDVILSIDSIFFGKDLKTTLERLKALFDSDGQMAIFCGDDLSAALKQNNLSYEVYDFSKEHYEHLQLKHRVARELKEAFEAESNSFIWQNIMTESIESTVPYDPATCSMSRYLWHVKKTELGILT